METFMALTFIAAMVLFGCIMSTRADVRAVQAALTTNQRDTLERLDYIAARVTTHPNLPQHPRPPLPSRRNRWRACSAATSSASSPQRWSSSA
jgi:hypothetical protein